MKYSILFLAILAVSCGEYKTLGGASDKVGDIRSVTAAQLSNYDVQKISGLCEALRKKEQTLNGLVSQPLLFTTSQEDCEGNKIPSATVTVLIQSAGSGSYGLKLENGLDFLFPTIETTSHGDLAGICGSLENPLSPIVSGTEALFYSTSGIASEDCKAESNEICIRLEKATVQEDGASAVVHTKEWLRVRTSSQDLKFVGFVTTRKRVSKGFCGKDEVQIQNASLKAE